MTKKEFDALSDSEKKDLVTNALCNIIILEDLAPALACNLFRRENLDVIKIVLGAYMNGEIS